jgi:hypothetical protein
MNQPQPSFPQSRPEVLLGATLYLMNAYRRSPCPGLAAVVQRHLEHLAVHPRIDEVLRDIAAGLEADWAALAATPRPVESNPAPRRIPRIRVH